MVGFGWSEYDVSFVLFYFVLFCFVSVNSKVKAKSLTY